MKQCIGFLYLKTGGGHISGARALSEYLQKTHPNNKIECFLQNGFSDKNLFFRFFFEKGYAITSNYFEIGYVAFYQLTKSRTIARLVEYFIGSFIVSQLVRFLKKNNITKVVCFHEMLIIFARTAINRVNPNIPLITIVTDPFTAHSSWFFEKNTELVVFSKKINNEAVNQWGFPHNKVHRFPLILSQAFNVPYADEQKLHAKKNLCIPLDKKIILGVGGGEGLRSAAAIVKAFHKNHSSSYLIIVCGKNSLLKKRLTKLVQKKQINNIKIFGFVPFMPDLINIADCVITKGGASSIFETLALGKPLILANYIRGQELGNMLYVVKNGLGWYISHPKDIVKKAEEIMKNTNLSAKIRAKICKMNMQNGLIPVANFIYHFS